MVTTGGQPADIARSRFGPDGFGRGGNNLGPTEGIAIMATAGPARYGHDNHTFERVRHAHTLRVRHLCDAGALPFNAEFPGIELRLGPGPAQAPGEGHAPAQCPPRAPSRMHYACQVVAARAGGEGHD